MAARKIYRAGLLSGILPLVGGMLGMVIGVCGLIAVGWESWYFYGLIAAFGASFTLVGFEAASHRLVVDSDGLTRTFWFGNLKIHASWDAIESWLTVPYDITPELAAKVWVRLYPERNSKITPGILGMDGSFTGKAGLFRVRGHRLPILVRDYEGWQPSYDGFLADVRTRLTKG